MSRRSFVRAVGAAGGGAFVSSVMAGGEPTAGAGQAVKAVGDEQFWELKRSFYDVDPKIINLNNGGCSPAPRPAIAALRREVDFSNLLPTHNMWDVQEAKREGVRKTLAGMFGSDAEELAITRNASESLETCLLGLELKRGDEILTSDQDYPRMMNTIHQRVRRDGVVLKTVRLPTPARSHAETVAAFEGGLTDRTRMILVSHVVFMTGAILPVREICKLARKRGIPCIVDGAHAFGQFVYRQADIDCDYYGTSLHKWINAPVGAGFLYVRREKIRGLWPLMPAEEKQDDDIRKYEEIGTHPAANRLAIAEALSFHGQIGAGVKEARLRYLRNRWAERLSANPRVRLLTNLDRTHSCAMGTMGIEGIGAAALQKHLFDQHQILVASIDHPDVKGIRVTANTYTRAAEVDRFCEVIEGVLKNGLPKNG